MATKFFKSLMLMMFLSTSLLSAQERGQRPQNQAPEAYAKQGSEQLKKELKLDEDQTSKVYELYHAQMKSRMEAMQGGTRGGGANMREKFQKEQEEMNDKIKSYLNDNQIKDFEKFVKKQQEQMGNGRGPRGGGF